MWWRAIVLIAAVAACAHEPTTLSEADQSVLDRSFQFEQSNRPVKITKDSVILDVRAVFDYETASLPDAVYINPAEFSLHSFYGQDAQDKATALARRLALMGITPFSHVVVMGYGSKGQGEEGRVALTLLAMGIERVQIVSENAVRGKFTSKPKNPRANQRYWEPRIVHCCFVPPTRAKTRCSFHVDRKSQTPRDSLSA